MKYSKDITGAIIDIDDTLIPWVKPHARAYPALSSALSKKTHIPEDTVIENIKAVNTQFQTIEYTALIQSMECFKDFSIEEKTQLIWIAQEIMRKHTEKYVHTFPGINVLLEALNTNLLARIALSDAPKNKAYLRLKKAKLIRKFIDTLIAKPSPSDSLFSARHKMDKKEYKIPVLISDESKPNTNLEDILLFTADQIRSKYLMIGNSESADVGLAKKYGLLCYQTHWDNLDKNDHQILQAYAPDISHNNDEIVAREGFELVNVNAPHQIIEDLISKGIIK